ncbi:MAG: alpha-L-fucosidase [Armatimonadetes bacterium]|nr:alpha-L-fucosidase [Armatimonadota bacterium]
MAEHRYEPNWASLDARPCPPWYDDAKLGIFIHWGVYSVPAWGPKGAYAEWYWDQWQNSVGETRAFHDRTYGADFSYQDFAPQWTAELFDAERWADIFAASGARYVTLTSKHHDGFCLWPSAQSWNWNSVDVGPKRDLVGEVCAAVRAKGLRAGLYYSLYEWYRPLYLQDPEQYALTHMIPQLRDIVTRYEPSLLFTDGEWAHPSETWHSTEFLAWLFNDSPVADEIAICDRWGSETRSVHGGYYTTEYGEVGGGKELSAGRKFEENRSIGASFGFNRNEELADYLSEQALIHLLIDTVSRGGNLMVNVGPTADGRIPVICEERLRQLGGWLAINGEAIYGTQPGGPAQGDLRFTRRGDTLYAISLRWPGPELCFDAPGISGPVEARLLGCDAPLSCTVADGRVRVSVPALSVDEVVGRCAWVVKVG